jgi:hypothetical protein
MRSCVMAVSRRGGNQLGVTRAPDLNELQMAASRDQRHFGSAAPGSTIKPTRTLCNPKLRNCTPPTVPLSARAGIRVALGIAFKIAKGCTAIPLYQAGSYWSREIRRILNRRKAAALFEPKRAGRYARICIPCAPEKSSRRLLVI